MGTEQKGYLPKDDEEAFLGEAKYYDNERAGVDIDDGASPKVEDQEIDDHEDQEDYEDQEDVDDPLTRLRNECEAGGCNEPIFNTEMGKGKKELTPEAHQDNYRSIINQSSVWFVSDRVKYLPETFVEVMESLYADRFPNAPKFEPDEHYQVVPDGKFIELIGKPGVKNAGEFVFIGSPLYPDPDNSEIVNGKKCYRPDELERVNRYRDEHGYPPLSATEYPSLKAKESVEEKSDILINCSGKTVEKEGVPGRVNEDAILVSAEANAIGVFDGMGGMRNGQVASSQTRDILLQAINEIKGHTREQVSMALDQAFAKAQSEVNRGATTASVAIVTWDGQEIGLECRNIGDSRIYLLRSGKLDVLTLDDIPHPEAQGYFSSAMSESDLPEWCRGLFRNRHMVTGGIGEGSRSRVHAFHTKLQAGDLVLAVSDGICDNLTNKEIESGSVRALAEGRDIADVLLDMARRRSRERSFRSKEDDMSVVVLSIGGEGQEKGNDQSKETSDEQDLLGKIQNRELTREEAGVLNSRVMKISGKMGARVFSDSRNYKDGKILQIDWLGTLPGSSGPGSAQINHGLFSGGKQWYMLDQIGTVMVGPEPTMLDFATNKNGCYDDYMKAGSQPPENRHREIVQPIERRIPVEADPADEKGGDEEKPRPSKQQTDTELVKKLPPQEDLDKYEDRNYSSY